ncbi:hypothetical protein ACFWA9_05040 [Kitasatospora sp. NPDC059973]|uniref:hypothetical protein n=1 Tax=Kitasatospora sp. NPDC059973 TaxID=3347020 RepID=UPI0036B15F0B
MGTVGAQRDGVPAGNGKGSMVTREGFAGSGGSGQCLLVVFDGGSVRFLGFTQAVVVLAEDLLRRSSLFVERGLTGLGLVAHLLAEPLVGGVVGERGPRRLRGRPVVAVGGPVALVLVVLHHGGGADANVDGRTVPGRSCSRSARIWRVW